MTSDATTELAIIDYATIARDRALLTCTDKIVPRKTVVLTTLVDPTVIKVTGERLKRQLFARFGILKPSSASIHLASMEKYYEPYIVISARYFLNYYRLSEYTVPIDSEVREVILQNRKYYPEKHQNSTASIKLEGEERLVVEKKSFFMLSKNGQDANLETLPSAPSEKKPKEIIKQQSINEIEGKADVDFVRGRLVCRPEDLSRIVDEVFEVGERVVIYAPRFKLTYVNVRNYEEKSIEFDGVTSKRIRKENFRSRLAQSIKSNLNAIFKARAP